MTALHRHLFLLSVPKLHCFEWHWVSPLQAASCKCFRLQVRNHLIQILCDWDPWRRSVSVWWLYDIWHETLTTEWKHFYSKYKQIIKLELCRSIVNDHFRKVWLRPLAGRSHPNIVNPATSRSEKDQLQNWLENSPPRTLLSPPQYYLFKALRCGCHGQEIQDPILHGQEFPCIITLLVSSRFIWLWLPSLSPFAKAVSSHL